MNRPAASYPKAKVRISSVQLVCRKCGATISIDLGSREPYCVNEWNEVRFPPTDICLCDNCRKKHSVPNLGQIIGKIIGVRS